MDYFSQGISLFNNMSLYRGKTPRGNLGHSVSTDSECSETSVSGVIIQISAPSVLTFLAYILRCQTLMDRTLLSAMGRGVLDIFIESTTVLSTDEVF
jgi:hypothetical protein